MKKLLPLLLPFFLSACVPQNYSSQQKEVPRIRIPETKVSGANIETIFEVNYKHPEEAKKVGDFMPLPLGEKVSTLRLMKEKTDTSGEKEIGKIFIFDRNGDGIPEYKFIRRFCDADSYAPTYAIHDIPNKSLYVDMTRNSIIDIVRNIDLIEGEAFDLPMKKGDCVQEKLLDSSDN